MSPLDPAIPGDRATTNDKVFWAFISGRHAATWMAAATSASDHGGRWPLMYLFDRGTFGQTARNGRPQRPRQPKLRGKLRGKMKGRLIETTWNAGRSRYRPLAPRSNIRRTSTLPTPMPLV